MLRAFYVNKQQVNPMSDTIFALATARGRSGVAIIRISGPKAIEAGETLAGPLPKNRSSILRLLKNPDAEVIDQALVLIFEKGASFTGEEVVELQLHGSPAVIKAVLGLLSDIDGLRMADPGEFTRRALDNGLLDLAQVEGLADLLEAETEAQRKQAVRLMRGALGDKAEIWRKDLLRAVTLIELTIDFADEEIPEDVAPEVIDLIDRTRSTIGIEIAGQPVSERIRDGFEVAIIGRPNVGKSTLLNSLAGRDAALTSEIAGTTRDVIEVRMDLNGLPVVLLDSAGLREAGDKVEAMGVELAKFRAMQADLRIFLLDEDGIEGLGIEKVEGDVVAFGKADIRGGNGFAVSGKTGEGVEQLLSMITQELEERASSASSAVRERHRIALQEAYKSLDDARKHVVHGEESLELAAEEMRKALSSLDSLIGRVDVENILDEIFSSFCLGK